MKEKSKIILALSLLFFIIPVFKLDGLVTFFTDFQPVSAASYIKESKTSKLGHIKNSKVKIYPNINKRSSYFTADTKYTNKVFYIKKQASVSGKTYYLISTRPSSTNGVIGWVEAKDLDIRDHKTVDKKSKTFTIIGIGKAYEHAWGGAKDLVYDDMSRFANQQFQVNLTETVGVNTWYRGRIDGKLVWLHSNHVLEINRTSKLGHLKQNAVIYKIIGDSNTAIKDTRDYQDKVYYIKQYANYKGDTYYLISTKPSNINGVIGWVKATEIDVRDHRTIDKQKRIFTIKGTGQAFAHAWGGKKDLVYSDLSKYSGERFEVNLTEKVGNNTWYRGYLDNKNVWIHESHLTTQHITYTKYNLTFKKAVDIQMKTTPQTDKYRNEPAYVSANYIKFIKKSIINTNSVRIRTSPKLNTNSNIRYTVNTGTEVEIIKEVEGDSYQGSKKWYQIKYKNETLYVHTKLVSTSEVPVTTTNLNVRAEPNTNSHIYGVLAEGSVVNIKRKLNGWYEISYTTWRNAKRSDVEYYLNPQNFINDEKQIFQFLDLSKTSGVTKDVLNNYLKNKGILDGMGQAFIDAANKHGINDIYLMAHALLETGNGTSELARGVKYNGVTVYNMFGIGAYDGCAVECGAKKAYEEGWTTPYKAIVGGAAFIGNDYIKGQNRYNTVQNTLYKMRWNPEYMERKSTAAHQYASDIGWAYKQVNTLYNIYKELGIAGQFDIPQYK